jgi:tetratricopeptide (TPR) repeat protein
MSTTVTTTQAAGLTPGIQSGETLLDLARGWLKQGNPIVGLELLQSALQSPEADDDRSLRANVLKETGRAWMMQSNWEHAEWHYLEAQRLFLDLEQPQGAAESARNRANMNFQRGRYSEAESLCRQALEWASQAKNNDLRATILNTLAAIESATGRHRESLKSFRLCLADFQASRNVIRQGYVLLNIGLANLELHEFGESTTSLNESLAIALTEKDLSLVEICYQNIAKCYLGQKEYALAQAVLETARKILPGLNSTALETELSVLEARTCRVLGQFETAFYSLEMALRKSVDNKLAALQADILLEQGLLLKEVGRTDEAIGKFNAAARQYREIGIDKGFREAIRNVESLKRGNYQQEPTA